MQLSKSPTEKAGRRRCTGLLGEDCKYDQLLGEHHKCNQLLGEDCVHQELPLKFLRRLDSIVRAMESQYLARSLPIVCTSSLFGDCTDPLCLLAAVRLVPKRL